MTMPNDEEIDRRSAETARISGEGNRIAAETSRVDAATARGEHEAHLHTTRRRKDIGQLLAYLLIVGIALVGFYRLGLQDDRVCDIGNENRNAIRTLVTATSTLGERLVEDSASRQSLNENEEAAMRTIAQFEKEQLANIPLPAC